MSRSAFPESVVRERTVAAAGASRPAITETIDVCPLAGSDRAHVWRVWLGAAGEPTTSIVVKRVRPVSGFASADTSFDGPAGRFRSEVSGLRFVESLGLDPPPTPRLLWADDALGVLALENLGDAPSLAKLLMAADRAPAEAALLAWARLLGQIAARSMDRLPTFEAMGAAQPRPWLLASRLEAGFQLLVDDPRVGVRGPAGLDRELASIVQEISDPRGFLGFSTADPCPDNNAWRDGGLRLFDLEGACCRHVLLDAVQATAPFPTCWCAGDLPAGVRSRLVDVYRDELGAGCPGAAVDAAFEPALARAEVAWVLVTVHRFLASALAGDLPLSDRLRSVTVRQLLLHRLQAATASPFVTGHLPLFSRLARELVGRLRDLWPDANPTLPIFPAFGPRPV